MKKMIVSVLLVMGGCVFCFAQTAEEIIAKTRTKTSVNSVGTRSKIEIQKSGKILSVLLIDQYSSKDKNGLQRTLIEFKEPAVAKGIRFLTIEQKNGTADQRIYLPKLGKVQRIAAESSGDEAFMGTDFSYNDVSFLDRDTALDTYQMLREENYDGKACYVIEALPKDKNYTYSKMILWIEKTGNLFLKGEFYSKDGTLKKVMELSNYKNVNGITTPHTTKLTTVKSDTATIINLEKIQYGMNIPDGVFTNKYLETGKR